ncbi:MAG TPA: ABC transporter ATP-binding protein [Chloroflexota bacterium]|nr:ABC transporter ATP-binding protein [Chloroflexota bacterium]
MRNMRPAAETGPPATDRGRTLRRLLSELGAYRRSLLLIAALVVVGAVAQSAGPALIGRAIDQYIHPAGPSGQSRHGDLGLLSRTMLVLLATYVVGALAQRGQISRVGSLGQRVIAALRRRIFAQLQRMPLSFFDRQPIGDLVSRVANDVDTLNQLFSQGLTQLLGSLFSLVGILIVMLSLDLRLALVSFTIIPVMIVVTVVFGRWSRVAYRATRQTIGDVTAELQEEISGVRQAQAFNRTETNIARFRERNAANRDANIQAVAISSAFSPSIDVLSTLATAIVIGYGGYLAFNGSLTVGVLTAFLIYVQQFFRPIQLVAQIYTSLQSALAGAERIYAVLDGQLEPPDAAEAATLGRVQGRIGFEDVGFAYDADHPVLFDVTFEALPGQTVALVGRTGAGKTTIASLIPRFYDVTAGAVRIDGHDVRAVTRASLRAQIAIVLQEPFLFGGTIAENIAYGRPDAGREAVEAAARAVDAHEFIAALPAGYDTVLGEGGGALSQGQRQLLTFARPNLADPRILILDEATSSIDTRTETIIQRALAILLAGRTSVVIAHRLSTIRNADQILVIDAGRIVERGTHDELLAADGAYAALYRQQLTGTREEGASDAERTAAGAVRS